MLKRNFKNQIPEIVIQIANKISQSNSWVALVGGVCIDFLQEKTPKDFDLEVYGSSYEDLVTLLKDYDPKTVGKQFGIIKLSAKKTEGLDIDVSIPRTENKIGVSHKDFACNLDPNMDPKTAAKRRDFTVNSLYISMSPGEDQYQIIDHYGGLNDLSNRLLSATCPSTFVEDPLRALRAMQLSARKNLMVDTSTMMLIQGMVDQFEYLSKERVYTEFEKLFLMAEKPSIGLEFLHYSKWIVHFPELHNLIGCNQNPDWHPEGDVWEHTLCVADETALARDKVRDEWRTAFVFGAILHDVGKPQTTVTPQMVANDLFPKSRLWTAWGHAEAGEIPARTFLQRLTANKDLIDKATTIVTQHMQPFHLFDGQAKTPAWKRLHNKIPLDIIGMMSKCDACGNHNKTIADPDLEHEISEKCFSLYADLGNQPVTQLVQGRHLIAKGHKPGPNFGPVLKQIYDLQIEDETLTLENLIEKADVLLKQH